MRAAVRRRCLMARATNPLMYLRCVGCADLGAFIQRFVSLSLPLWHARRPLSDKTAGHHEVCGCCCGDRLRGLRAGVRPDGLALPLHIV